MKTTIIALLALTLVAVPTVSQAKAINTPVRGRGLARLTVYWAGGSGTDYWSKRHQSATGVPLRRGHCAVDPSRIGYGSKVKIKGVGTFLAVDTGSAVVARAAAKKLGKTKAQKQALVVDLFFEKKSQALAFAKRCPKFVPVEWSQ